MQPEDRTRSEQQGQRDLTDLLKTARALVRCATWEEGIAAAIEPLVETGAVLPGYIAAAIAREKNYPTGLPTSPCGVALPHADGQVNQPALSLVTLIEPVAFAEMGTPEQTVPVKIVIALALQPHQQTDAIAALMQLIQHEAFLEAMTQAAGDDELHQIWRTWTMDGVDKE
jgi:PTS system galactitol-specific IIA component